MASQRRYNAVGMPVFTKRWDDPIAPTDGTRILITRYRPRGLPKAHETWTEWLSHLGPSPVLLAAFHGKGRAAIGWTTYRTAYLKEMRQQSAAIAELARRSSGGETITLLCSSACVRETRCHRSLLRGLIEPGDALNPNNR